MAVVITWTKEWSSSDDGTVLSGANLENIQNNIESHYHTGGAATAYSRTFSSMDLTAGVLSVAHNLGIKLIVLQVYDNNYKMILPDEITLIDTNNCTVDVTSYTGSTITDWNVKVMA